MTSVSFPIMKVSIALLAFGLLASSVAAQNQEEAIQTAREKILAAIQEQPAIAPISSSGSVGVLNNQLSLLYHSS